MLAKMNPRIKWRTGKTALNAPLCAMAISLTFACLPNDADAQIKTETSVAEVGSVFDMPTGAAAQRETAGQQVAIPRPKTLLSDEELEALRSRAERAQQLEPIPQASTQASVLAPVLTNCETNPPTGGGAPPDIHGAAGPRNLVVVTNVDIGVFKKSDCSQISLVSLKTLFAAFSPAADEVLFDPRVLFDPGSGRFFATAESFDSGTDQFQYYAVSTDSSGTSWYTYRTVLSEGATVFCKRAADSFWDYPDAGYSEDRWFFGAADFGATTPGAILSIDKAPSLVGIAPEVKCFNGVAFNVAPPLVQDSNDSAYFLSPGGAGAGNSITRYRLDEAPSVADDTLTTTSSISITPWIVAPNAPQPNGELLDVLDGRFQSATIQRGTSLWNIHTVNSGGRGVSRFYEFSTTGNAPLFAHSLSTGATDHVFNPSIATNGTRAFVTASRTDPSAGAPAGNAAMLMFNGPNDSAAGWEFSVVETSTAQFTGCGTYCRWGDYSSIQIDPSDSAMAWGFNQLADGTTQFDWATRGALVGKQTNDLLADFGAAGLWQRLNDTT
jgi:hypothetical protein